jgi:hypothetical protein
VVARSVDCEPTQQLRADTVPGAGSFLQTSDGSIGLSVAARSHNRAKNRSRIPKPRSAHRRSTGAARKVMALAFDWDGHAGMEECSQHSCRR